MLFASIQDPSRVLHHDYERRAGLGARELCRAPLSLQPSCGDRGMSSGAEPLWLLSALQCAAASAAAPWSRINRNWFVYEGSRELFCSPGSSSRVFPLQVPSLSRRVCLWSASSCWLRLLSVLLGTCSPSPGGTAGSSRCCFGSPGYCPRLAQPVWLCRGSLSVPAGRTASGDVAG